MPQKPRRTPGDYPLTQEREYQKELTKPFRAANNRIIKKVKQSYLAIKNQAERELGLKNDSYDQRVDDLIRSLSVIVEESIPNKTINQLATKRALSIEKQNRNVLAKQVKRVTGLEFATGNEKWLKPKVKEFTKKNASLISNVKETHLKRIESTVRKGVSNGYNLKRVTEDVRKAANISENRAKLIARDQISSLNSELTMVRQRNAGISSYTWSTSLDERVRDEHAKLEGRTFSWKSPPSVGHPGEDINCRCVAIPVIDGVEL